MFLSLILYILLPKCCLYQVVFHRELQFPPGLIIMGRVLTVEGKKRKEMRPTSDTIAHTSIVFLFFSRLFCLKWSTKYRWTDWPAAFSQSRGKGAAACGDGGGHDCGSGGECDGGAYGANRRHCRWPRLAPPTTFLRVAAECWPHWKQQRQRISE